MPTDQHNGLLNSLQLFEWTAKNLPVRFFGDDILHKPCEAIGQSEFGTAELKGISEVLTNTLAKYREHTGMGRGIAANQVGYLKQMVVVWLNDQPKVLINPRLVSSEGKGSYWESCISSGTLLIGEVHRPWQGIFKYQDLDGEHHTLKANEKETRILLHEIDHLQGIVCTDRYEPRSLRFIQGGKAEVFSYQLTKLH